MLRGARVAQSVERPTSAQVMISPSVGSGPASGSVLTALEPVSDSVSPSLWPSPIHALSLSQGWINVKKKNKKKCPVFHPFVAPPSLPLATIHLFSVHTYAFSGMAHSWNHTVRSPFGLASLTWRYAFKIAPWVFLGGLIAHFFFFHWIIFHRVDRLQFTHSLIARHLSCFQYFVIMNKTAIDIHVQVFVWTYEIGRASCRERVCLYV